MEIRPVIHGRALARPAFKERPDFYKFQGSFEAPTGNNQCNNSGCYFSTDIT